VSWTFKSNNFEGCQLIFWYKRQILLRRRQDGNSAKHGRVNSKDVQGYSKW
jgi:hypothetical protein